MTCLLVPPLHKFTRLSYIVRSMQLIKQGQMLWMRLKFWVDYLEAAVRKVAAAD